MKPKFKWIYVCSPYAGDRLRNRSAAIRYCKYVSAKGYLPICPHIFFTQFLDDCNPVDRALGMIYGADVMTACAEMWIFGEYISPGMQQDIDHARDIGVPTRRVTDEEVDIQKEKEESDDA